MSIIKPYTFIGGTKARASEVNDNFDRLYEQVNTNIIDIANLDTSIENIASSKANINGDPTKRFSVADPINEYDAVNKRTIETATSNTINILRGFRVTKDGTNKIIIGGGSCYDSTSTLMITNSSNISLTNSSQLASATYYVYIISDATGTNITGVITADSSSPSLPSGYTLYRKIAYYTTSATNKIDGIYNYNNIISEGWLAGDAQVNYSMPNYASRITRSVSTTYTAAQPGYVHVQSASIDDEDDFYLTVSYNGSNQIFRSCGNTTAREHFYYCIFVPVPEGATYRVTVGGYSPHVYWIPCIRRYIV